MQSYFPDPMINKKKTCRHFTGQVYETMMRTRERSKVIGAL
jgi:hypothetical protein